MGFELNRREWLSGSIFGFSLTKIFSRRKREEIVEEVPVAKPESMGKLYYQVKGGESTFILEYPSPDYIGATCFIGVGDEIEILVMEKNIFFVTGGTRLQERDSKKWMRKWRWIGFLPELMPGHYYTLRADDDCIRIVTDVD